MLRTVTDTYISILYELVQVCIDHPYVHITASPDTFEAGPHSMVVTSGQYVKHCRTVWSSTTIAACNDCMGAGILQGIKAERMGWDDFSRHEYLNPQGAQELRAQRQASG